MLLRKILMRSPTSLSARIAARLQSLDRLLRYFFTGCLIFFWIHRFTQPFDRFRKKDCQSEIPCLEIPIIYEVSLDRQADGSPNFEFPPRPPLVRDGSLNDELSLIRVWPRSTPLTPTLGRGSTLRSAPLNTSLHSRSPLSLSFWSDFIDSYDYDYKGFSIHNRRLWK